ncbi:MAG TPA: radical SAM protein, partial [Acidobacteriota bacterium]|nr:radical SAM protein [Acidobacteriota bacterium]
YGAPTSLSLFDLLKKFDKSLGLTGRNYGRVDGKRTMEDIVKRRQDPWNFLFIAGMWFQDLFNYDFRRTEMCIIPYGTQEGEISFCAYNTGVGWRNILEDMHQNAKVAEWYKKYGRHEIFAKNADVPLETTEHHLVINEDHAARVRDRSEAVPMTAAEEKAMMRKLFNEKVLGQKSPEGKLVQLGRNKAKKVQEEPVGAGVPPKPPETL